MENNAENYPLSWPLGYKRTAHRKKSIFKQTMDAAQRFLRDELRRMGARDIVVSSNIPIRRDGGMYSDYMNKKMEDPGVAVYFKYNTKPVVMCCDQYSSVWENVYALAKGLEALRGMERWGVSEFLDRAFTGFTAIEAPTSKEWYDVLEVTPTATIDIIKINYRRLCMDWHPDKNNGDSSRFLEIQEAYEKAKKLFNFS